MEYPAFIMVNGLRAAESRMDGMHVAFYAAQFLDEHFTFAENGIEDTTTDDITDMESLYYMGLEPYATSDIQDFPRYYF